MPVVGALALHRAGCRRWFLARTRFHMDKDGTAPPNPPTIIRRYLEVAVAAAGRTGRRNRRLRRRCRRRWSRQRRQHRLSGLPKQLLTGEREFLLQADRIGHGGARRCRDRSARRGEGFGIGDVLRPHLQIIEGTIGRVGKVWIRRSSVSTARRGIHKGNEQDIEQALFRRQHILWIDE